MPLVSARTIVNDARSRRYAVPLFDVFEMSGCEDVIMAAEHIKAPVIMGIYHSTFESPKSSAMIAAIRNLAEHSCVPVALMLDHGVSVEQCLRALECGLTDVMYDGSRLPLNENIANTAKVVQAAHAVNAGVEAELGHVGSGSEYATYGAIGKGFTDPAEVAKFVSESGVDMLAVAIGTAHGVYKGEPRLQLDLLDRIQRISPVPLVLHGGTGLSEEQFRQVISRGIAKINVATDLVLAMAGAMREAATSPSASFFSIMSALHRVMGERCSYYLELFGCCEKAMGFPVHTVNSAAA